MKRFYEYSISMSFLNIPSGDDVPLTSAATATVAAADVLPAVIHGSPPKKIKRTKSAAIATASRDEQVPVPADDTWTSFAETSTHTLPQLKYLCRLFKVRLTGNKTELKMYIKTHLCRSWSARKVQKQWRKYMAQQWSLSRGPARFNRALCVNTTDFCTMDDLSTLPFHRFFSFCGSDNKIYGFDILSFYNLCELPSSIAAVTNPYTREGISIHVYLRLLQCIDLSKILYNQDVIAEEDEEDIKEATVATVATVPAETNLNNRRLSPADIEREIHVLFRAIDDLGNYSDPSWLLDLERPRLLKFLLDLNDIWSHRANLRVQVKRDISPYGNPFELADIIIGDLEYMELQDLRLLALKVMIVFVHAGVNRDSQILGAMYVLGALTLSSHAAATALPWLFDSFL